jgi:hypothetical protein
MSVGIGFTDTGIATKDDRFESTHFESSSSSNHENNNVVQKDLQHDREIHDLVRRFTSKSELYAVGSPFAEDPHHWLDPSSDHFQARKWARSFYDIRYSGDKSAPRVAGVAFKGLNVWGKGTPTDFQSTVGNTVLKLPSLFGRGALKVEILRDLDGLLLPGEQLCVLGPPGYALLPFTSQRSTNTIQVRLLHAPEDHLWRDSWLPSQP